MEELFEYKIEDGKACITKYLGSGGDVVIPEEIEGTNIPVTSIGEYAFYNNELSSIDLSGVKSIGYGAFCNNNLEAIILPDQFRARTEEIFGFDEKELDNRNKKYIKKYVDKMRELYIKKLYKNSRKHGLIFEYITYYTYHESYSSMLEEAVALKNLINLY